MQQNRSAEADVTKLRQLVGEELEQQLDPEVGQRAGRGPHRQIEINDRFA